MRTYPAWTESHRAHQGWCRRTGGLWCKPSLCTAKWEDPQGSSRPLCEPTACCCGCACVTCTALQLSQPEPYKKPRSTSLRHPPVACSLRSPSAQCAARPSLPRAKLPALPQPTQHHWRPMRSYSRRSSKPCSRGSRRSRRPKGPLARGSAVARLEEHQPLQGRQRLGGGRVQLRKAKRAATAKGGASPQRLAPVLLRPLCLRLLPQQPLEGKATPPLLVLLVLSKPARARRQQRRSSPGRLRRSPVPHTALPHGQGAAQRCLLRSAQQAKQRRWRPGGAPSALAGFCWARG